MDRAFADSKLTVDDRRIVKHKMPLAHRGAVLVDQGNRTAGQRLGQFFRIGNRCAAQDELRMASVEFAQAQQTAQDVGQVAAENAPVGMDFVDNDILQVFKELDPFRMMRQDAGMQHVRIGHDDVPGLAHGAPRRSRGIPVIRIGFDIDAHFLDHFIQLADLIGGEGFCREKVKRPGVLIPQDRGEHREIVAHGFSGSGGCDDSHILPPGCGFQAGCLVDVQFMDAAVFQRGLQPSVHPGGEQRCTRGTRGKHLPPGHVFHEQIIAAELLRQL